VAFLASAGRPAVTLPFGPPGAPDFDQLRLLGCWLGWLRRLRRFFQDSLDRRLGRLFRRLRGLGA